MVTAASRFMKKVEVGQEEWAGVDEFRYLSLMSERRERCLLLRQKMDGCMRKCRLRVGSCFFINIQTFS